MLCKHLHFYNTVSVSHQVMKSSTQTCGLLPYRKYAYKLSSGHVQRPQVWVFGQGNKLGQRTRQANKVQTG